jgi:hypothetical protein
MSTSTKGGTRSRTAGAGADSHSADSGETPAFIEILLRLVEDKKTQHLCSWAEDGNTFIVHDPDG